MGLREELGGKLELALNKLVDEKLATMTADGLKTEAHKLVDGLIDKHIGDVMTGLADKLKKDVIDLIDGEDDIK